MRSLAHLAGVLALAMPVASLAQDSGSDSQRLQIAGEARPACVISQPAAVGGVNAVFAASGPAGGTITITQLVNPQTAEPEAASVEISLPAICNTAHRVVVTSADGGLQRVGGQRGLRGNDNTFGDMLPYSIAFDWGSLRLDGTSDDAPFEAQQDATQGEMRLTIATTAGGGFLTAGTYSDNVTIRFEPAS